MGSLADRTAAFITALNLIRSSKPSGALVELYCDIPTVGTTNKTQHKTGLNANAQHGTREPRGKSTPFDHHPLPSVVVRLCGIDSIGQTREP